MLPRNNINNIFTYPNENHKTLIVINLNCDYSQKIHCESLSTEPVVNENSIKVAFHSNYLQQPT